MIQKPISFLCGCALLAAICHPAHAEVATITKPEAMRFGNGRKPQAPGWSGAGAVMVPGPAGDCVRLGASKSIRRVLKVSSREEFDGGTWIWFSARIWGMAAGGGADRKGELSLRIREPGGRVLAENTEVVTRDAPVPSWTRYTGQALSPNYGRVATRATDGNVNNEWVSTPKKPENLYFDLLLDEKRMVAGLRYLPRPGGNATGQVYDYEILVSESADDPGSVVVKGTWPKGPGWREARFPNPVLARKIRLKAIRTQGLASMPDQIAMSAAEIEPVFDPDISTMRRDFGIPKQEAALALPASVLAPFRGKEVVLEISNAGNAAVDLGEVCVAERPVDLPERKFKPRHSEFIDLNALGLTGLTREHWSALQVYAVEDGSPADRAGLAPGQIILSVDGHRLPPPRLEATRYPRDREWLERHHEAFIARLFFNALLEGRGNMEFEVGNIATGEVATKIVPLSETDPAAWKGFPLEGRMADALYLDLIAMIVREQKPDGSWKLMPASMSEAFGIMALLGTRDAKYSEAIYKAADRLMAKPPPGGRSYYLELWDIAFRTMGIGEYALATGDPRAVAWLDATCNAMVQGANVNNRNYLAFGHDRRVLPYGTGGLIAPLSHMVIGDSLARRAGVRSEMARLFDPYIRAGWADNQAPGRRCQGYGAPSTGGGADQAWCRSGLIALNCHLRGENDDIRKGLVAFMEAHHGFMRRSHGYGNPGGHLGLMSLAGADPAVFKKVMTSWAPVFAMQWQPGKGLRHVESQITNTFGANPEASAQIFSYSMAVVLSARRAGLHVTGATDRNWLPTSPDALPPVPVLVRETDGIHELRAALMDYVTARHTTDGSEPTAQSPVWKQGMKTPGKQLRVAYEGPNGKLGPSAAIATEGEIGDAWLVVQADGAFPELIHGIADIEALAIERAQYAFDGNPATWFRTNNGIRDKQPGTGRTWAVTVKLRPGAPSPAPTLGWIFPAAPHERSKVDDSARSVKVDARFGDSPWKTVVETVIPDDRRVMLARPITASHLRFTFTSRSGTLLILPDVEFIRRR